MIYFESGAGSMYVGYKINEGAKADFKVWNPSNCQDRVTVLLHGTTLHKKRIGEKSEQDLNRLKFQVS